LREAPAEPAFAITLAPCRKVSRTPGYCSTAATNAARLIMINEAEATISSTCALGKLDDLDWQQAHVPIMFT
jgi:hypothetical protein